ncbi:YHYH protein [Yoonia sp. BS5-3]|uniref:YHYH protein n=1 Tax=Yoonia phaeophyticola TaxID=3137369 RepID=A0ABZ2V5V1_9RHOB
MSARTKNSLVTLIAALAGPGLALAHSDTDSVAANALLETPQIVDCTLENGDPAQCVEYVVKYLPDDLEIGPFCPATTGDVGGIWDWDGENPGLYRIDADYLQMLADQGYVFFDENGTVNVFDIRVEGPTAPNECISGSVDESVSMTVLIPMNPVMADTPTPLGTVAKVGLGVDGVPIFADAPSVLDRGHMPALDTCGGHVDPGGWFHWHATATDIDTVFETDEVAANCANVPQDPAALFGYAFDGFAIYGSLEADGTTPAGLDACGGHVGPTADSDAPVYHYHASETFPNLPSCLVGVVAQDNFTTTAAQGIGSARAEGGAAQGRPDFSQAAAALGVDASALEEAMRAEGGRDADLAKVAERLGVTVQMLEEALPGPGRP